MLDSQARAKMASHHSTYRSGMIYLTAINLVVGFGLYLWTKGHVGIWLLACTPLWTYMLIRSSGKWEKTCVSEEWTEVHIEMSRIRALALATTLGGITMAFLAVMGVSGIKILGVYLAANGAAVLIQTLKLQWEIGLISDKI